MITRQLIESDLDKVKEIHEKFYASEFAFPNFRDPHYLPLFTVVDENGTIISAGGLRSILESVIITNKDFSPKDRRTALLNMLQSSIYVAGATGYNQIHAFVKESDWQEQLKRYGFAPCKGSALYLPLGYQNG